MASSHSRSRSLRPNRATTTVPTVIALVVITLCAATATGVQRRQGEWNSGAIVIAVICGAIALAVAWGLYVLLSTRLWIDYGGRTLYLKRVSSTRRVSLAPPTTVGIKQTGNTPDTAMWQFMLSSGDGQRVMLPESFISTADIAEILQPVLADEPALASDDETRYLIANPETMRPPSS